MASKPLHYIENGKYVFTEQYHLNRGYCCGCRCKNCVFEPKYQKGNNKISNDFKKLSYLYKDNVDTAPKL